MSMIFIIRKILSKIFQNEIPYPRKNKPHVHQPQSDTLVFSVYMYISHAFFNNPATILQQSCWMQDCFKNPNGLVI